MKTKVPNKMLLQFSAIGKKLKLHSYSYYSLSITRNVFGGIIFVLCLVICYQLIHATTTVA